MKLSMILVSYNEKEYISEAIESCLRQKCDFPFEIIIGDDGSNDGSIAIIERYHEMYPDTIRYFVMDRSDAVDVIPSIRASNVLKRGFQMARGEYLMVMSSDDLLLVDNKLARQVAFLEKHPDYASCYTAYKMFWEDGSEMLIYMHRNVSSEVFWSRHYMHISCFVFRKAVLDNLLDRCCDDTGLLFSLLKTGKTKQIPMMAFGYRQRGGSIMREADKMELMILELMLCQDVFNAGGYEESSRCRYRPVIKYIYENRTELEKEKYSKYLVICEQYENNYLGKIAAFDYLSEIEQNEFIQWMEKKVSIKLRIIHKVDNLLRKVFNLVLKIKRIADRLYSNNKCT